MSTTITPTALQSLLAARPTLPVIDVRTPAEFEEVHAVPAVNLPLDTVSPEGVRAAVRLESGEPFYILCRSGGRADTAAHKLDRAGLPGGVVVTGGTEAWVKAGLPAVRGRKAPISIERQVRIGAGALVFTGVVLGWFVHRYFLGLPAFVGAGLVFAGITDWCGMGLLLAKAPWNRKGAR